MKSAMNVKYYSVCRSRDHRVVGSVIGPMTLNQQCMKVNLTMTARRDSHKGAIRRVANVVSKPECEIAELDELEFKMIAHLRQGKRSTPSTLRFFPQREQKKSFSSRRQFTTIEELHEQTNFKLNRVFKVTGDSVIRNIKMR